MLYAHLYNSPVGDIRLIKDEMDLIGLSFSNQILNNIEAKIDINLFKIIIDQLNEYFYEGRKNFIKQNSSKISSYSKTCCERDCYI